MANTPKAGVNVRYFQVTYNKAEVEEYCAAVRQLKAEGAHVRAMGSFPDGNGGATISFIMGQHEADDFVDRIRRARIRSSRRKA